MDPATLHILQEKYKEKQKDVPMIFVDLGKSLRQFPEI